MALRPTFEKFLEPLLDQKIPLGVRLPIRIPRDSTDTRSKRAAENRWR
jgi:hypothetical protein